MSSQVHFCLNYLCLFVLYSICFYCFIRYSLLGASGCGKTTALSCVIGINKLDSGKVLIFGERPGSPSSGIPGKRLGYMPQGIVLNREFTMTEVLHYFGKIYGMSYEDVEERRNFFVDFLNLKTIGNTQVGNLR